MPMKGKRCEMELELKVKRRSKVGSKMFLF